LQAGARAEKPGMEEALAALQRGETYKAEALFDRIAKEKAAEGASANKEAARALRNKGNLLFLHDTHAAMAAYARATELDPDDPEGWNELGRLQFRTGALDAAMDSFERVLSLSNQSENNTGEAIATGNLAMIFQARGELDRAEAMQKRAFELAEELGIKEQKAAAIGNLALIYQTRGELNLAESMHRKALELNEELRRHEGMAMQYGNLGLIYMTRGELDRAEAMYKKICISIRDLGKRRVWPPTMAIWD